MTELPSNGRTLRRFYRQGYLISEVEFYHEELAWCIGYMIGIDDGRSGLYTTPEEAIADKRKRALVPRSLR